MSGPERRSHSRSPFQVDSVAVKVFYSINTNIICICLIHSDVIDQSITSWITWILLHIIPLYVLILHVKFQNYGTRSNPCNWQKLISSLKICHDDVRRHCKFYSFDPGSEATWYKSRPLQGKIFIRCLNFMFWKTWFQNSLSFGSPNFVTFLPPLFLSFCISRFF